MASTYPSSLAVTAWDPSCPTKLVVFEKGQEQFITLWCGSSGCNAHELSALIRIVQAHKDYHDFQLHTAGARVLGQICRSAIKDCLAQWEEERNSSNSSEEMNDSAALASTTSRFHDVGSSSSSFRCNNGCLSNAGCRHGTSCVIFALSL
jgi:hypothetical protein